MASGTRNKTEIYLLGSDIENLTGSKLPSIGDVMRFFLFKMKNVKNKHQAATMTIVEVEHFWNKARIPVRPHQHAIKQLENLIIRWECLKKNKNRRSDTQIKNENEFQSRLSNLFDISHQDAMSIITIEEDREFLLAQREDGRRGVMAGVDTKQTVKDMNKMKKIESLLKSQKKKNEDEMLMEKNVKLESSSESDSDVSLTEERDVFQKSQCVRKRGRKNILSDDVLSSLDRTKTSSRKAVLTLSAVLHASGQNIQECNLNYSSVHRARQKFRLERADQLKRNFCTNKPLTLHWDGKLMLDLTGDEKIDRLPIIVSGSDVEQLLSIPKLKSGTGQAVAEAIIDVINDWGIKDNIRALSFDTTVSNTGKKNGSCILIEQFLNRDLLYLACRHHIHEIMLEEVFTVSLGPSSGPEVGLFKRFKSFWQNIDVTQYKPGIAEPIIFEQLHDIASDITKFAEEQLQETHPRDDYKELLELVILFLGSIPQHGVHFRKPGAMHRARWMAKLIYSLKIFLFRGAGFIMNNNEKAGVAEICIFGIKSYVKSWFLSRIPAKAPSNDLNLLKSLVLNNSKTAKGALKKLSGQLWYLSEELVALSFFDREIDASAKKLMVASLDREAPEDCPKRITIDTVEIVNKHLHDFITKNSRNFFSILSLPTSFLQIDPEEWVNDSDYLIAEQIVHELRVVNDTAERGVALMQKYNCLTKDEDQMQFALQVIQENKTLYPNCQKSTILKGLNL